MTVSYTHLDVYKRQGLYPADVGLGIHVLVTYLDGDEIAALRPQVERAITDVQQLTALFRVKVDFFRFTLYRCFLFFLLRHNLSLIHISLALPRLLRISLPQTISCALWTVVRIYHSPNV